MLELGLGLLPGLAGSALCFPAGGEGLCSAPHPGEPKAGVGAAEQQERSHLPGWVSERLLCRDWGSGTACCCFSTSLEAFPWFSLQTEQTMHPGRSLGAAVTAAEEPAHSFSLYVMFHKPWAEKAISHLLCTPVRRGRAGTLVKLLQPTPCAHPFNCQCPLPASPASRLPGL